MKQTRDFSRNKTAKTGILYIQLAKRLGEFTVEEIHERYIDQVGAISERTTLRYLAAMKELGIVQSRAVTNARNVANSKYEFTWLGVEPL